MFRRGLGLRTELRISKAGMLRGLVCHSVGAWVCILTFEYRKLIYCTDWFVMAD